MATKEIKKATFEELNKLQFKLNKVYNANEYRMEIMDFGNSFVLEIHTKASYGTMFSATLHEFLVIIKRSGFLYWFDVNDNQPRVCVHGK